MNNTNASAKTLAKISSFLREVSLLRLEQHAGIKPIEVIEMVPNKKVLGKFMALIMIVGDEFRLTLQAHYQINQMQEIFSDKFKNFEASLGLEDYHDLMREYCNLCAGMIKNSLLQQNQNCTITLPFVTQGFDQIFFLSRFDKKGIYDYWRLKKENGFINISVFLDFNDEKTLEFFDQLDPKNSSQSSVEFL